MFKRGDRVELTKTLVEIFHWEGSFESRLLAMVDRGSEYVPISGCGPHNLPDRHSLGWVIGAQTHKDRTLNIVTFDGGKVVLVGDAVLALFPGDV